MKIPYHLKRRTINPGWQFTVPVNQLYEFRWNLAVNERADIETFSFDYSDVTVSDKIWLRTQVSCLCHVSPLYLKSPKQVFFFNPIKYI